MNHKPSIELYLALAPYADKLESTSDLIVAFFWEPVDNDAGRPSCTGRLAVPVETPSVYALDFHCGGKEGDLEKCVSLLHRISTCTKLLTAQPKNL